MKIKSVYTVNDSSSNTWALEGREELFKSIIDSVLPNKQLKIYHHFFVIEKLGDDELTLLDDALTMNKRFNIWKNNTLSIFYNGEIICDDDGNILDPNNLNSPSENQLYFWEQSLPWPSEDDDEMFSSETEVLVP